MAHENPHSLGPLLLRSRAGDAAARNSLLDRVRPYLKVLIRSWIGPARRGQLADSDIVQVTLLRINQHLHEFRGDDSRQFLAWARIIAHRAPSTAPASAIGCSPAVGRCTPRPTQG